MIPEQRLSSVNMPADYLPPDDRPSSPILDYELGGIYLRDASRGLQYQVWTLTVDGDSVSVEADNTPRTVLFSKSEITEASLAFDQNMNPFVAYVAAGSAWYYWFDTVDLTQKHTELGPEYKTPKCCMDDKRTSQLGTSDVILAYIKNDSLYFRAQRDRYTIEYLLKSPAKGILKRVGMNRGNRLQFAFLTMGTNTVPPKPPKISGDLDNYTITGQTINFTYLVTDGYPPFTFEITNGQLPDGITLDNTGTLSGVLSKEGYYAWRIRVTDSLGKSDSLADGTTVTDPMPLEIDGGAQSTRVGLQYEYTYPVRGGIPPYIFSVTSGTLPPGITLDPLSGTLSGSATVDGEYEFTIQVKDDTGNTDSVFNDMFVWVSVQTLILRDRYQSAAPNPPDGQTNVPYKYTYAAYSGTPPYVYDVSAGTLPDGLILNTVIDTEYHQNVGVLEGKPTKLGSFTFTVRVTDADNNTASKQSTVIITAASIIITPTVPDGWVLETYRASYAVAGASYPLHWELIDGALPAEVFMDTFTGEVFGTPIEQGQYTWTQKVTDANNTTATVTSSMTIREKLLVNIPNLSAHIGDNYNVVPIVTGGVPPYFFVIDDVANLPPGLLFAPQTGGVEGVPTTPGHYIWTITVIDSGSQTVDNVVDMYVLA